MALWWAYLLPLIITVSILGIVTVITNNELLAATIAIATTALYFLAIHLALPHFQRKFIFTISKYYKTTT
jgi:hypothetical protein